MHCLILLVIVIFNVARMRAGLAEMEQVIPQMGRMCADKIQELWQSRPCLRALGSPLCL